jgi:uncharacterized membrane protein YqaE (UPF0057 family)
MASNRSGNGSAAIVAALFLPPLGVFLDRGITPAFWIATVLTILFFVPGVIFALVTILKPNTRLA